MTAAYVIAGSGVRLSNRLTRCNRLSSYKHSAKSHYSELWCLKLAKKLRLFHCSRRDVLYPRDVSIDTICWRRHTQIVYIFKNIMSVPDGTGLEHYFDVLMPFTSMSIYNNLLSNLSWIDDVLIWRWAPQSGNNSTTRCRESAQASTEAGMLPFSLVFLAALIVQKRPT